MKELSKILELSVDQRILIVEQIWNSIAEKPDSVLLTDDQKQELDKRLQSFHKNPEAGTPWRILKYHPKWRSKDGDSG